MRQRMVVTDITRMQEDRVCIGGYLEDGTSIRPVCERSGPTEAWLQPSPNEHVAPFSLVELDVGDPPVHIVLPHTEDRIVPSTGHHVVQVLPEDDRLRWLERSRSASIREIFGAEVHSAPEPDQPWGRYVKYGEGARSLGTIRAESVLAVPYRIPSDGGRRDYRLSFTDGRGEEYQLAVVDLAFRHRLDALHDGGLSQGPIAARTLGELRRQVVYVRIGLARRWTKRFPDRCYLQVTGVYGFDQ